MADGPQVIQTDEYPEPYTSHDHSKTKQPHLVYTTNRYQHDSYIESKESAQATILGLRRRNFWILLGLLLVVLAATIGGSIGGTLAVQNRRTSPPTQTLLSTSASPPPHSASSLSSPTGSASLALTSPTGLPYLARNLSDIETIDVSCPPFPSILTSLQASRGVNATHYDCLKDTNLPNGNDDIASFTAYTLDQCMDACSQYNLREVITKCVAVVIDSKLGSRYRTGNGANCWLKSNGGFTTAQTGYTVAKQQGV